MTDDTLRDGPGPLPLPGLTDAGRTLESAAPLVFALVASGALTGSELLGRPLVGQVLALGILGVLVLVRARSLTLGLLSPFPVSLAAAIGYVLPISATLTAAGAYLSDERAVGQAGLARGAALGTRGLLALCLAYGLATILPARPRPFGSAARWWSPASVVVVAGGAAILGATAVLAFVFVVAGLGNLAAANYGSRYLLMEGRGPLLLGAHTFVVAMLILLGHAFRGRRGALALVLAIGGLVPLALWTQLIGSRNSLIQFVVGAVTLRHILWRRFSMTTIVAGAFAVLLVASLFGFVRSGLSWATVATTISVQQLNPANSELGAPVATIADISAVVPREEPYRLGSTYVEAIGVVVPKFVWRDRPPGPAQWYARRFYPEIAEVGGAFAFSPVAEAYLNFGLVGVFLLFSALGVLLNRLERRFATASALPVWPSIVYACALPFMLLFSRFDAASLVKLGGVFVLGQLAAIYVVARIVGFLSTARPPAAAIEAREE